MTFEYMEFNYEGHLYDNHAGHCIPTEGKIGDGSSCNSGRPHYFIPGMGQFNWQCCAPFTWSERAVDFFNRHPCHDESESKNENLELEGEQSCENDGDCADDEVCGDGERRRMLNSLKDALERMKTIANRRLFGNNKIEEDEEEEGETANDKFCTRM